MNHYRDDPRWIEARYPGHCHGCDAPISRGEQILYWPKGKRTYANVCAETRWARFTAEAADEERMAGR